MTLNYFCLSISYDFFIKTNAISSLEDSALIRNKRQNTVINVNNSKHRCMKMILAITLILTISIGIIGFALVLVIIDDEDEIEGKSYCCTYEQLMHSYSDMASLCYVILDTASTETRNALQHFCEELDQTSDTYAFKMNSEIQLYQWDGCQC